MAFRLGSNATNSVRKKSTDAIVDAVDAGTTNTTGSIKLYSGAQPATPETAPSGTLLVAINFANPAFADSDQTGTAGLTGGTAISASVTASGTPGYFRIVDRDGNALMDGSVTATGSGGDLTFDNTTFVSGATATISSFSVATPM